MKKMLRQISTEVLWLMASLSMSLLLSLFLFGKNFLSNTIDIHWYDTYFVMAPLHIVLPIFLFVTFIIYFIREFRNSFRRTLPNLILIILGLTLVIALTFLIKTFSQPLTGGWTLYPPLSALGPDKVPEITQDPATKFITNFLIIIQVAILAILLFVAFRWGFQKRMKSSSLNI